MIGEEAPLILKSLVKGKNVNNSKKNRILTECTYAFFRYQFFLYRCRKKVLFHEWIWKVWISARFIGYIECCRLMWRESFSCGSAGLSPVPVSRYVRRNTGYAYPSMLCFQIWRLYYTSVRVPELRPSAAYYRSRNIRLSSSHKRPYLRSWPRKLRSHTIGYSRRDSERLNFPSFHCHWLVPVR